MGRFREQTTSMEHLVSITEVAVLRLCWPLCQDLRCAPRQHKRKALRLASLLLTLGVEVKWAFSLFPSSGIWVLGTLTQSWGTVEEPLGLPQPQHCVYCTGADLVQIARCLGVRVGWYWGTL